MTTRTLTADITVGQEMAGLRVVELLGCLLYKLTGVIHLTEIIRCERVMGL